VSTALDGAVGEPLLSQSLPGSGAAFAATLPPPPPTHSVVMPATMSIFEPGSSEDEAAPPVASASKMVPPVGCVRALPSSRVGTFGSRSDALAESLFHSDGE
jgi:hypothetical protein